MSKKRALDSLFPRTRQAILTATLLQPDRWWYLSDLAKHLGVPPSSLQRELAALVGADILRRLRCGLPVTRSHAQTLERFVMRDRWNGEEKHAMPAAIRPSATP